MLEKINVVFVGDSLNIYSGFSYVIVNLMKGFHRTGRYRITYVNILSSDNDISTACRVHGNIINDMLSDEHGPRIYNSQIQSENAYRNFDKVIEDHHPSIVVSLIDPWQNESIINSRYRNTFFWVKIRKRNSSARDGDNFMINIHGVKNPPDPLFRSVGDKNLTKVMLTDEADQLLDTHVVQFIKNIIQ